MATYDLSDSMTAMELAQGEHNGELIDIIDVLSTKMEVLLDARWRECNNGTTHKSDRWSTEPSGSERDYNEGIDTESSTSTPVEEPTCMIEAESKVDSVLLRHSPDKIAERFRRDQRFLKGIAKTFGSRLFYGNRGANPKQVNGILTRGDYNSLSSTYVHDDSGGNASVTANKTSIVCIGWGPTGVELLYPRNDINDTVVGVRAQPFPEDILQDANGKDYRGYVTWFESHFGLMIYDPRAIHVVRNISTSNIDGVDDFSFNEDYLIDAVTEMEAAGIENIIIYANSRIKAQMWKRAKDRNNINFNFGPDMWGNEVVRFGEYPIRMDQSLANTEAKVT